MGTALLAGDRCTGVQHGKLFPVSQVGLLSFEIPTEACTSQALLAVVGFKPSWLLCQAFSGNLCSFLPFLFLSARERGRHFNTSFFQHLSLGFV